MWSCVSLVAAVVEATLSLCLTHSLTVEMEHAVLTFPG